MGTLADVYHNCHSTIFFAMYAQLASDLGVTVQSVEQLGLGYDYLYQAWVIPERDSLGNILGLSYRYANGKKTMAPGLKNKRGLVYPINQNFQEKSNRYIPGSHNWVRVAEAGVTCPICKKHDGCLVSAIDPLDPTAVICIRPEGKINCTKELGQSGYLHIFKKKKNITKATNIILLDTDLPILIVEGMTDVLAALSMGFVAIGRPNSFPCENILGQMPIANKPLWVIGENDSGAGKEGMDSTFQFLKTISSDVIKVLPPAGIKDLRNWYNCGLNQTSLINYVELHGVKTTDDKNSSILDNNSPLLLAERFLRDKHTENGVIILRKYFGGWLNWINGCYKPVSIHELRGQLYSFLGGKKYFKETTTGKIIVKLKADKKLISDILDALNKWCPVKEDPPVWLYKTDKPKPKDLIAFSNGLLDVNKYIKGDIVLYDPDPSLFILNVLPYKFNETLSSQLCHDYFMDIFNGDQEPIKLVQQWMGYNLVPDTSQEKMMLFTGRPRSGKSTTLDMLRALLGYEQCCALQMSHLYSRFGKHPMLGKLAATFADVKTPRASESGMALETLLTIVGQDAVSIDRKGSDEIPNVKLCCRITLVMNDIPVFSDHARALAPRMLISYFPNSYVGKEDKGLKAKLVEEVNAGKLIIWALEGLKSLRQTKHFVEPVSSMSLQTQLELANSPVLAFVNECCTLIQGNISSKNDLFALWAGWCHVNNRSSGSKDQFGRWLLNACPTIRTMRRRSDNNSNSEREYCFNGIEIKSVAKQMYIIDRIR
jgi:putative DNA primase/helicase